ncbi:guanine nucleotide exchange factor synembryn [Trichoderma arundinaceum]|uniref:Guanine nucleotide exchange factor synembryn n=1 Tax=Trichoderma arundinaceum TaxID=490622 RepID=A0A395NCP3_TRIAR|nr:guanine nucleotide exchange factor synembryn [Trichoderma arundinaceum]
MPNLQLGTATGPAKLKAVTALVNKLTEDLDKVSLLPQDRDEALEELKIYGRDPRNADPIFTKETNICKGISMLLRHGFHSPSSDTARAALRVLANSMLLKPETRRMLVDQGFAIKACEGLKTDNWDTEFLISRILLLSTYGTKEHLTNLIAEHNLAENITENLGRHARLAASKPRQEQPMEDMALGEILKLLFNVTHFCKEEAPRFSAAVPHIVALFWKQDIPASNSLDSPFGPLVNALINLDISTTENQAAVFPSSEPTKVTARLISLLDSAMATYSDNDLEVTVTPLISTMLKVHEHAPSQVRQYIGDKLLPTAEDRQSVLGNGKTLSARLLKNSTNPMAPALRDAISHLLFEISDKDASKFVENVGYGFASGFLFQNNVPIPANASATFNTGDSTGEQRPVNPITGQFLDQEKVAEMPPMTEDEKLREAERLFVLFER